MSAAKNSLLMVFAVISTLALNYFFNVALGWLLPTEEYGVYGVAISLLMILGVFVSSGFPLTAAKFLSEKKSDLEKLRIFKSALIGNTLLALAISAIFLIIYFTILNFEKRYDAIAYLIALCVILSGIASCYRGALQGSFRFKRIASINIISTITKFSGVALVIIGFGTFGAIAGILISSIIALTLMFYALHLEFWKAKGLNKKVFSFAFPTFIGLLSITFIQNIDLLFLRILTKSDLLAGFYQAALTIARIPFWVVSAIVGVLFPYISNSKDSKYSNKALKYFIIFLFLPALLIFLAPEQFIRLIYPERYLPASNALSIAVLAVIFLALSYTFMNALQAIGKPKIPAKILFISLILQTALLLILIPKFGILGAPTSTLISMLTASAILSYYYIKWSNIKLHPSAIAKFVLVSLTTLICFSVFPHSSLAFLILDLLISLSLYITLITALKILNRNDIEIILKALPVRIPLINEFDG